MKHLGRFGLAMAAAAVALGSRGAGPSSATTLCKEPLTTGCAAAGQTYVGGTALELSLTAGSSSEIVAGGFVEGTCTGSTLKAKSSNTGSTSETVSAIASAVTWSGCSYPTSRTKLGTLEIHWISGTDNGTFTASGFEWTTQQPFGSCVYKSGTGNDLGTLKGGKSATLLVNTVLVSTSGGFCAATVSWQAAYTVTSPAPLYIASS